MEDIPPPVVTHFPRNGFSYASNSHWYDWITQVDNSRETRSQALSDMDSSIDEVTMAQRAWLREQKLIKKRTIETKAVALATIDQGYLRDCSEVDALRNRLGAGSYGGTRR